MVESIQWHNILVPDKSPVEMVIRGSIMYLSLFALLRVILKRQAGTLGMTDLLLVTLLADASQNGMAGEYKSLPDALVLVTTLIFWNYFLDWLSFRSAILRRLIEPEALLLVKDGKLQRRNMRRELITEDELMSQLREQGSEDFSKVKRAFMERDGRISVIQTNEKQHDKPEKKKT